MIGEIIGKVFGTDKAVASVVDNVAAGLDKLVYTSEEEAEDRAQAVTEGRQMLVDWMRSTQGQNLARRIIALSVTGVWLFQYLLAWVMDIVSVFVSGEAQARLVEASTMTDARANSMIGAVTLVLGFYFAAPHMGNVVESALAMFGRKPSKDREG